MKNIYVVFLSICFIGCVTPNEQQEFAEHQAETYAAKLGLRDVKTSCVSSDSDNDGYVSCTIVGYHQSDSKQVTIPVECATKSALWQTNSGCKVPKNKMVLDQ